MTKYDVEDKRRQRAEEKSLEKEQKKKFLCCGKRRSSDYDVKFFRFFLRLSRGLRGAVSNDCYVVVLLRVAEKL